MNFSPELLALANYLAGEFENQQQALAQPAWYVHLRLWQRFVPLFSEDSLTLFAEQANIVNLDQPYRQRIMRLTEVGELNALLKVQYYMPKDPLALRGAGRNPSLLHTLTPEQLDLLPGCILNVTAQTQAHDSYKFAATPPPGAVCCFNYAGRAVQVALGFEVTHQELITYDKGIDPTTGGATWGAILGPYRYTKREQY
ncbi:MAG: chromophore lyase CpcT/CpeT [Chlorogloeopsis fritschii C42_A2020_084]|uniref:chromophore lyase CpcT/CpeT n=1 Tax=Chlorogloeopsis fritschii TaxID=1124 RepID=UPI001A075808|nr:chromophore lyase CpcT/CpeT [Chlorogloeopsis fritschii]MBF2006239.1 chromophore lyase CpcT/CpeT [Chlorogloeopsis fritschii C42_A2020_084]